MGGGDNPSRRGKIIESPASDKNNPDIDEIRHDIVGICLESVEEGGWEAFSKKSLNNFGADAASSWGRSNTAARNWEQPEALTTGTDSYIEPVGPPPVIAPPLKSASQLKTSGHVSGFAPQEGLGIGDGSGTDSAIQQPIDYSDDDDSDCGDDNDELANDSDDEYTDDSDASQRGHETKKKSRWFRAFFEALDALNNEEINGPTRQWHCPVCKGGPGAIDWYRGLQPLIAHAKTKGSRRVKLHRDFAELLEEELQRRGTFVILPGEVFGKWKGLRETMTDHEIVWPPMVVIMNTQLDQDENEKWIGMGNQELLEYFSAYEAIKARHSYGPRGHRGMSILIFEATAVGYMGAELLHKHFAKQGTDREAWERHRVLFYPSGKRQLYGFLACKEDIDKFNQYSQGKSCLKFEMRSYQEMVVCQMKQMNEDNQQLLRLKNKVAKQEQHKRTLEESFGVVSQKLHETLEENRIVRERTMTQHEQHKEEMDSQEQFFKEQIAKIHMATKEKEKQFERLLQEEHAKAKQADVDSGTQEDQRIRREEIAKLADSQVKGVKEFEEAREQLIHEHEEKNIELWRRYLEEKVGLERVFDGELTKLMEKYAPGTFQALNSS